MYKIIGADGKEYGPISADQLRQWIREGRANAQTQVLAEGATEWKALAEFPEFGETVTSSPPPSAPPGMLPLAEQPRNNGMAIAALVMGILALTVGLCCYGLPFNVLGIVFSLVGLSQIKNDPQNQAGRGFAIAGLVLSILSIILGLVFLVLRLSGAFDVIHKMRF